MQASARASGRSALFLQEGRERWTGLPWDGVNGGELSNVSRGLAAKPMVGVGQPRLESKPTNSTRQCISYLDLIKALSRRRRLVKKLCVPTKIHITPLHTA